MLSDLEKDENLLARLDRMPFTATAVSIIILLSFVWLAEAFDIGIVGPVISVVRTAWHLSKSQLGLLSISSTLGVVLGMIPAGMLADRIGRKKVILYGILIFSVITVMGTFVQSFWPLCAIRFFAGIGEGAVLPLPYLYLSEFVRSHQRAVSVGYANGILTAAYLLPSLAGAWAINTFSADIAWRIPFTMGFIPLLLLIPVAIWLPESPRFLLKRGQRDEVQALVEKMENRAGLPHDETLINRRALAVIHKGAVQTPGSTALFRPPYLSRGLVVLAQLTGALILFYIILNYGSSMLEDRGFGSGNAQVFTGVMMGVAGIGSIIQGYLSDSLGRKRVLFVYYLLAAVGCAIFGLFSSTALSLIGAFLTSFFGLGVFPVAKTIVPEQYPTRLRGKGVYYVEMGARLLSGVLTLFFIPFLMASWDQRVIYEAMAIALLVLSIPVVVWGRETANVSVEEAGTNLSFDDLDQEEAHLVPGARYHNP